MTTTLLSTSIKFINASGEAKSLNSAKLGYLMAGDVVEMNVVTTNTEGTTFTSFSDGDAIEVLMGTQKRNLIFDSNTGTFRYTLTAQDSGQITAINKIAVSETTLNSDFDPAFSTTFKTALATTVKNLKSWTIDQSALSITAMAFSATDSAGKAKTTTLKVGDIVKIDVTLSGKNFDAKNLSSDSIALNTGSQQTGIAVFSTYNASTNKATFIYTIQAMDRGSISIANVDNLVLNTFAGNPLNKTLPASITNTLTVDTTAPMIKDFTQGVISTTGNLELVFDEAIQKGSGSIVLRKADNTTTSINVQSTEVTISADKKTLIINPKNDLVLGTYNIDVSANVVQDLAGNGNDSYSTQASFVTQTSLTSIVFNGKLVDGYLSSADISGTPVQQGQWLSGVVNGTATIKNILLMSVDNTGNFVETTTLASNLYTLNKQTKSWSLNNTALMKLEDGNYRIGVDLGAGAILSKTFVVDKTAPTFTGESIKVFDSLGVIKADQNNLKVGDKIELGVTSSEEITGLSTTNYIMVGRNIKAMYSRKEGNTAYFTYNITSSNSGLVDMSEVTLNLSSTVKDLAGNTASLTNLVLFANNPIVKVDSTAPTFSYQSFSKSSSTDTLSTGENKDDLTFTFTSNEVLRSMEGVMLNFTLAGQARQAKLERQDGNSYTFKYTLSDLDATGTTGITVSGLNNPNITDLAGNRVVFTGPSGNDRLALAKIKVLNNAPNLIAKTDSLAESNHVIVLNFDEVVQLGTGKITVTNMVTKKVETAQVLVDPSGKKAYIQNMSAIGYAGGANYNITMDRTAFLDQTGQAISATGTAYDSKTQKFSWTTYVQSNLRTSIIWNAAAQDGYLTQGDLTQGNILSGTMSSIDTTIGSIVFKHVTDATKSVTLTTGLPTIASDGKWTLAGSALSGLADKAQYTVEVNLVKVGGAGVGKSINNQIINIYKNAPDVPIVQLVSDTGASQSDGITSSGEMRIPNLITGSTWSYQVDGASAWFTGVGSSLSAVSGLHTYQVKQQDIAGNTSQIQSIVVNLDNQVIASSLSLVSDTGLNTSDFITNNNQLRVNNLEAGSTWSYQVDGTGAWFTGVGSSLTMMSGQHTYQIKQRDLAGNTSPTQSITVSLDNQAMTSSLSLLSDTGLSSSDFITNNNQLNVNNLEIGSTWSYQIDGTGAWFTGVGSSLTMIEGQHSYQIKQQDVAGNTTLALLQATLDTSVSPAELNRSVKVAPQNNLALPFNEMVMKGTGNIVLTEVGGTDTRTIDINDNSQISFSLDKKTLIINPTDDLNTGTYNIAMASGVIKDVAGNDFAGYSGSAWQVVAKGLGTSINWMKGETNVGADGTINSLESIGIIISGKVNVAGYSSVSISKIVMKREGSADVTLTSNLPTIAADGSWALSNSVIKSTITDTPKYTAEIYLTSTIEGNTVSGMSTASVAIDGMGPVVSVASGEVYVNNKVIQLVFNEAVTTSNFIVLGRTAADTGGVSAQYALIQSTDKSQLLWSEDKKTLSIKPSQGLLEGMYDFYLTDFRIIDLVGNSIQSESITSLPIVSVTPALSLSKVAQGTGGFVINGENTSALSGVADLSGTSVSSAGDVNGDGFGDLIVSSYQSTPALGKVGAGKSYVVFGKSDTTEIDLSKIVNGTGGFAINGENAGDWSGISVSSAGDVNGDGLSDLIVGANYADPTGITNAGKSYVIFGKTSAAKVDLSQIASGTGGGFVIDGESVSDYSGVSVSSAGDVNGDGLADLIIGAKADVDMVTRVDAGKSYVVFGKTSATKVDLTKISGGTAGFGSGGFVINGEKADDQSGYSVSSAGDVNGDGLADLIVGAYQANTYVGPDAGKSYVVFGKIDTNVVELSKILDGSGGFVINGQSMSDYSGYSVSSAGDVNGDGLADLIVGANKADPTGRADAGKSYVVFGKTTDTNAINLSNIANGTGGFAINGQSAGDQNGYSVSSAGDMNGDGLADLIVGSYKADSLYPGKTDNGRSYVVFGKTGTTVVELSNVYNGTGGFAINGENTGDNSGVSVSSAGDINGDGLADLIIGANKADTTTRADSGKSYVIFGSISSEIYQTKVDWMGTSADDTKASTSTSTTGQTLVGGDGNDTLTAGQGADVLYGGRGDDIFVINSNYRAKLGAGFDTTAGKLAAIDGGFGIDTISLGANSGITNLDLTAIKNIASGNSEVNSRIASIEKIDLSVDSSANTLKLSYKDIQDMSGMNWINSSTTGANGKTKIGNLVGWVGGTYTLSEKEAFHQLVVNGGGNDQVDIDFSTTSLGTVTNSGVTYNVYQDMDHKVEMFVQSGLAVI